MGEQYCLVLGLFSACCIEQRSKVFLSNFSRNNPTALLIAHILISNFRYDYCGSIPLVTALSIFGFLEQRLYWFEIDIGCLRQVPCLNKQGSVWRALLNVIMTCAQAGGMLVMPAHSDVYDCMEYTEMVE